MPNLKSMAFSPDGRFLALGGERLQVWDLEKKQPFHETLGETRLPVSALAFSPDGKRLLSYEEKYASPEEAAGEWRAWDVSSGRCLQTRTFRGCFAGLSPCGRYLAIREEKKPLAIVDSASGKQLLALEGARQEVLFARSGQVVGVSMDMGTVEVWDVAGARKLAVIPDRNHLADLSADGRLAATTSGICDSLSQFWRIPEPVGPQRVPTALTLTPAGPDGCVTALAWSPDSRRLAVSHANHTLRIVQAQTGKELIRVAVLADVLAALTFSPRGDRLATLGTSGRLSVRQCDSGKLLAEQASPLVIDPKGLEPGLTAIRFSRAGDQLLALGGKGQLHFWNVGTARKPLGWKPREPERALAVSPDARLAVTSESRDQVGPLRLRELSVGSVWAQVGDETSRFGSRAAFSPDGRLAGLPRWDKDGRAELVLLETATGQEVCSLPLGGTSSSGFRNYGTSAGLAFSPDNRYVAVADGSEVSVHDLVRRRPVALLRGHDGDIKALAFSPDGRTLATGSDDCTVLLWDANWRAPNAWQRIEQLPADPEALWRDLSGTDSLRGQEALWRLAQRQEQALPLLQRKLQPIKPVTKEKLATLLRELEHDEFARRERARQELVHLESLARPLLRAILEKNPNADLKRQAELLLDEMLPEQASPQRGRISRAITVLERIGSPEACRLLRRLAEGEPTAYLTQQARQALQRLEAATAP